MKFLKEYFDLIKSYFYKFYRKREDIPMNILFYRYNSICEPDIIAAFTELGHTVKTIDVEITNKDIDGKEVVEIVSSALLSEHFDGVFSINYYPVISAVCNIFKTLYISWTVDSPVVELLSDTVKNPYNRIFLFDYAQYQDLSPYNPDCIFYLPLAANCRR
jgi:spore maturation protein CgeB